MNRAWLPGSRLVKQLVLFPPDLLRCVLLGSVLTACDVSNFVLSPQVLRNEKIFTDPNSDFNGVNSATDGDLDAAYALLMAGQKWHEQSYTERGIKV